MSKELCDVCGASPCYHLCPNSPHYYSPEQEMHDEAMNAGAYDDHHERYASTIADAELFTLTERG